MIPLWLFRLGTKLKLFRRMRFTILYNSGAKVHVRARHLKWQRNDDGSLTVEWDNMWPIPVMFGLNEVVAIWAGWL